MASIPSGLEGFLKELKADEHRVWSDDLAFFRDALTDMGWKAPPKPEAPKASSPAAEKAPEKAPEPEPEPEEEEPLIEDPPAPAELEKDDECWAEDDLSGYSAVARDAGAETSDEQREKAMEGRSAAMAKFSDGDFSGAVEAYTDAIKIAPNVAPLWAGRAQAYLKLKKPNSAIKDATVAIDINSNNAKAYKMRGTAYRRLAKWEDSAKDLWAVQKIDFDDDVAEMLKIVAPRVKKIQEWRRECERCEGERKMQIRKRKQKEWIAQREREEKEEEERRKAEAESMGGKGGMPFGMGGKGGMPGGMPGMGGKGMPAGMPPGMMDAMSDPEVQELMQDPEVMQAMAAMQSNPMAAMQYMSNPKVAKVLEKMMGGMGGMGTDPHGRPPGGAGGY